MVLVLGDTIALLIVTMIGFATHGEADLGSLPRFSAVFAPLILAWFGLAPWFGLFQEEIIRNPRNIWRAALVMIFAGPLAVVLRGLLLNASIIPVFAVVLSATSAVGLLVWRGIYALVENRKRSHKLSSQ